MWPSARSMELSSSKRHEQDQLGVGPPASPGTTKRRRPAIRGILWKRRAGAPQQDSTMTLEELDDLFKDPANRRWGVFYHCPSDPRIIAPSRPGFRGYQINFANPSAAPVLIFYLATMILPVFLVFAYGPRELGSLVTAVLSVFAVSIAFLIALSANLSKRHAEP